VVHRCLIILHETDSCHLLVSFQDPNEDDDVSLFDAEEDSATRKNKIKCVIINKHLLLRFFQVFDDSGCFYYI